jgi:pimeloyl-ACP methyl ester carboxylesterase
MKWWWGFVFLLFCKLSYSQSKSRSISDTLSITLENVSYAYPINFFNVEVGCQDLRMAYMDVKPDKPNGSTIILFHGKNFGGYYWTNVIDALKARGYRVLVPDQIGFGKSSKPIIQYSFHLLATQNKKLIDSLGIEKVTVLGHSMGGMLAIRFALMYPNRVKQLILENPIGLEDYRTFVPYATVEEQYNKELKTTESSVKRYYQTSYFPNWKTEYDYLVKIAAGVVNSAEFPRYAKVAALTYQMIYEQPVVHELENVSVPALLLIGTLDKTVVGKDKLSEGERKKYGNYNVLGKSASRKMREATLVEFAAGHIPHLETPDQFLKMLMLNLK